MSQVTAQFPQGKLGSRGGQESSVSNISDTAKTPVITPMTPKSPPKSNSSYSLLRPNANGDNSTSNVKKASFADPAATIAEVPPAAAADASSLAPAISAGPLQGHWIQRDLLKLQRNLFFLTFNCSRTMLSDTRICFVQAGATTLMKKSHSHVTFHDEEPSSSFERNTSSPCSKDNSRQVSEPVTFNHRRIENDLRYDKSAPFRGFILPSHTPTFQQSWYLVDLIESLSTARRRRPHIRRQSPSSRRRLPTRIAF